ncbi:MAG: hypothetical protein BWY89_01654 [Bacteroidetes bacterium ADurb.BinA012]|nr:MAG: hypothetical protein BWY89_01654 [Bacteroidetes bacterium ADurb.BinA012]
MPVIQFPSMTLPLPWMSFWRPEKFHMKYLMYITPTWYLKKNRKFSPKVGRVTCSSPWPDLTVIFFPLTLPQYSYSRI